jgi:uncharacterized membrane protein
MNFWIAIVGSVLIYLLAKPMRLFAIGTGDISEIIPLVSFSSLFSLIFGWIFLGEVPTNWGLLGVTLISLGGYYMNFDTKQTGTINRITHPFKKVVRSKTHSFLFLSLILGPISSVFDKMAINNTFPRSPHYALLAENLILIPLLIPILFIRKVNIKPLKDLAGWKVPIMLSVFFAVGSLLGFSAISVGYIGYVAAIRQLSSLVAVVGGYYFLKEKGLRKRLLSTVIMGIGAFLIGYLG